MVYCSRLTVTVSLATRSPRLHLEKSAILIFIVQSQHDLIFVEHLATIFIAYRKIRVYQGNNRLNAKVGIAANDCQQVLLLAIIERLKYTIVVYKAWILVI